MSASGPAGPLVCLYQSTGNHPKSRIIPGGAVLVIYVRCIVVLLVFKSLHICFTS